MRTPQSWQVICMSCMVMSSVAGLVILCEGCAVRPQTIRADTTPPPTPPASASDNPDRPNPEPFQQLRVQFAYDSSNLDRAAVDRLRAVTDALLARPDLSVDVEGHCDERGTDDYNMDLGWKRAYAVTDYLRRVGVASDRLFPISYGRSRPLETGHGGPELDANRRVQFAVRNPDPGKT